MARRASPTFAEAVDKVIRRLGISRRKNQNQRVTDLVREYVASAHLRLFKRHWWARRAVILPVSLSTGVGTYDVPDSTSSSNFEFVWITGEDAEDPNADPEAFSELVRKKPEPWMRNEMSKVGALPTPRIWWTENDRLNVGPAPGSEWGTLYIQCQESDLPVEEDRDPLRVDMELVVMHALKSMHEYYGNNDLAQLLRQDIPVYEDDLRADTAEGETFTVSEGNRPWNKGPDAHGVIRRNGLLYPLGY